MSVKVSLSQVLHLAPNVRLSYREAFQQGQAVLDRYKISENPLRVAHFMAQILHESGGLAIQFENLNYSAQRLPKVWPSRFKPKGSLDPAEYANNPKKLANEVYGGRMGNTGAGDGFTYRGRGLLQLTGKESYREATLTCARTTPRPLISWPCRTKWSARSGACRSLLRNGRPRNALRWPTRTTSRKSPAPSTAD